MTIDVTSHTAALQEYYVKDVCESLYLKDTPLYVLCNKDKKFGGKPYLRVPMVGSMGGGKSTNFTAAQNRAIANSGSVKEFQVPRAKTYAIARIDAELIRATRGNMPAWIDAVKETTDFMYTQLYRDWEITGFRAGYGDVGQVGTSSFSTTTITLKEPTDAYNFMVGDELDLSAAVGSTVSQKTRGSSGNGLIVTGVDYDNGILTFGYNVNDATNGIPTIAQNDYFLPSGDIGSATSTNSYRPKPTGMLGYAPDTAPTGADSFFGLNRSVSGLYYGRVVDASAGLTINEALVTAVGRCGALGGKDFTAFLSFNKFASLLNELGTKVRYNDITSASVSFRGVVVQTPRGDVTVLQSTGCNDGHGWLAAMDDIGIASLDDPAQAADEIGFEMFPVYNADQYELRLRAIGNYYCRAPGRALCNIKF